MANAQTPQTQTPPSTETTTLQSQWETVFQTQDWGKYPPEYLIRLVARHFYKTPDRSIPVFLDLGCGSGSNSWFLCREGFTNLSIIDISETAIKRTQERLDKEGVTVASANVGSITSLPYSDNHFDCVIDCGTTTSNPWDDCTQAVAEINRVLKPGGLYFAMYLGQDTTIEGTGPEPHYYNNVTGGPLSNAPTFRLFNRTELETLLAPFTDHSIEYELRTLNNESEKAQTWVISAKKKR